MNSHLESRYPQCVENSQVTVGKMDMSANPEVWVYKKSPPNILMVIKKNSWTAGSLGHLQQKLGGGWTNPSEKYAQVKLDLTSPNMRGGKFQQYLSCHHPLIGNPYNGYIRPDYWGNNPCNKKILGHCNLDAEYVEYLKQTASVCRCIKCHDLNPHMKPISNGKLAFFLRLLNGGRWCVPKKNGDKWATQVGSTSSTGRISEAGIISGS